MSVVLISLDNGIPKDLYSIIDIIFKTLVPELPIEVPIHKTKNVKDINNIIVFLYI